MFGGDRNVVYEEGDFALKIDTNLKVYVKHKSQNQFTIIGNAPYGLRREEKLIFLKHTMEDMKNSMKEKD